MNRLFALLFLACFLSPPAAPAQQSPPAVTADDLRRIESKTQDLLPRLIAATVGIDGAAGGQGSGVIVDESGLVLTAGHVSGAPGQAVRIFLSDGRELRGETLGRNGGDDAGMIRITTEGKYPFVEIGDSTALQRGDWVLALGHPGGYRRDRPPVLRIGRFLRSSQFLVTDAVLVGGDSGGPLFTLDGKLVGIHSRIGGAVTSNMHVATAKYQSYWDRLVNADDFNRTEDAGRPYLGLAGEDESDPPGVRVTMVEQSGPAGRAGLEPGDVITRFNDTAVARMEVLRRLIVDRRVGEPVRLEVVKENGEVATLQVRLGRR